MTELVKKENLKLKAMKKFAYTLLLFAATFAWSGAFSQGTVFNYNSANDGSWNGAVKKIYVNGGDTYHWRIRDNNGKKTSMVFGDETSRPLLFMNSRDGISIGSYGGGSKPFSVNLESSFTKSIVYGNNVRVTLNNGDNDGTFGFDFQNDNGKALWRLSEPTNGDILTVRNNGRVGIKNANPTTDFQVDGGSQFNGLVNVNGNLGLGVSAPTEKFEVEGNAKVSGTLFADRVSLTVGTFPDYVFDESYNLRSLADLESFIKENKHLPGVKPERKVVKDGMDLGEMNQVLMEKVEELTLYTIQQQKLIDGLQNRLDKIENQK